jgi:hypothetical protein
MGRELPVYRLRENPFEPRVLNPVSTPTDAELFVGVDGFRTLYELDEFLFERAGVRESAIFLIVGERGTGRTSAANFLVYRWARHADIHTNQLIVHRSILEGDSAEEALYKLVFLLSNRILNRDFPLSDTTQESLDELRRNRPAIVIPSLQQALKMMDRDLRKEGCAFSAVIEDVEGADLVRMAVEVFSLSGIIVVLIADTNTALEQAAFRRLGSLMNDEVGRIVELRPIIGTEVSTLVEKRWQKYSSDPSPFDPSGMATAFSDKPRSIARTLQILSLMLQLKQIDFRELDPWPASPRLAFDAAEISDKLRAIEEGFL